MEFKAAYDSGVCIIAERSGEVAYVSANEIVVKTENGEKDRYKLTKFE